MIIDQLLVKVIQLSFIHSARVMSKQLNIVLHLGLGALHNKPISFPGQVSQETTETGYNVVLFCCIWFVFYPVLLCLLNRFRWGFKFYSNYSS